MKSTTEYCDALGIKPSSTPEQFKQAYRDLVNVWHPDRFAHDPRLQKIAEEKLKEINEAYEHLKSYFSNPRRESSSSERTRSKTKHEQPKANEPPPKPPPNANSQPPPKNSPNTAPNAPLQDIQVWLRKPWLVGVFAFMVVGALI